MSGDPPTLESLMFAWDDAYIFAYARDRWIAIRRDGLLFLTAGTLTQLQAEIDFDYANNPVMSECDSLDAVRDYLTADPASPPQVTEDLLALAVRAAEAIIRRAAERRLRDCVTRFERKGDQQGAQPGARHVGEDAVVRANLE